MPMLNAAPTALGIRASDSTARVISAARFGLLCRASPVGQRARCDRDESAVSTCCTGSAVGVVVSVNVNQSGAEDVWQARPGGDGNPADRGAGGLAGRRCGSRGLLRAGYGARQAVSC